MPEVLVSSATICHRSDLIAKVQGILGAHAGLSFLSDAQRKDPALWKAALHSCDAVLLGREPINAETLQQAERLRAVALYGVGHDNIDLGYCQQKSIETFIPKGINAASVAEHTLGMMISLLRRIHLNHFHLVEQNKWVKNGGIELAAATVGIIGFGAVGQILGRLLRMMGARVLLYDIEDRYQEASLLGCHQVERAELMEQSDVITLHVPLTPLTSNMVDGNFLQGVKQGSYLINTSRGGIVDLYALKAVIRSGHLAGAGLDVFAKEPADGPALREFGPELLVSPHTAGNGRRAVGAMVDYACQALLDWIKRA